MPNFMVKQRQIWSKERMKMPTTSKLKCWGESRGNTKKIVTQRELFRKKQGKFIFGIGRSYFDTQSKTVMYKIRAM